jgi:ankyrin repeat protein
VNELKMDPFKKTASNQTALMLASSSGNLSVFKEIFEGHKSTIENEDVDGKTALFYALNEDSWAILEYLVSAGANVNHTDKMGNTPVMKAAQMKRQECYFTLKQAKPNWNLKNMNGENVISFLMYSFPGSVQEILDLNSLGVPLNVKSLGGETMAYYAMSISNMEILTRLKNTGVSLDAFNSSGHRPDCKNPEIIQFAIANGCNPNREDDNGESYLSQAIKNNQLELALFLIRNGADVNWKKGDEPIICRTVLDHNLTGLQVLVENGAKLNVTNRKGESLMDLAEMEGNEDISNYLRNKGAKTKKELAELEILRSKEIAQLDQLIAARNMPEVKVLLEKYPDVILSKTQVSNLAILSIEYMNMPLLQRLIEKEGMNINQPLNFQEQNLLHIAAGTGNLDLVRLLINKGADFKKKDAYDKYPVDYAKSKEVKKYLKGL